MKKVLVGMFALVACAGMAMAASKTKPTTYTCQGYKISCTNKITSGTYCSSCENKKNAEIAKNAQEEYCKDPDTTSHTKWMANDCDNYNKNK